MTFKGGLKYSVFAVLAFLVVAQFFQPARTNPVSSPEMSFSYAAKPSPEVVSIVERCCRDCHSNDTVWPWYSRVAPVSWLVASDVKDGRNHLNFSQWGYYGPEMTRVKLKEMCNEVKSGDMPLWIYTVIHRKSKLSEDDVRKLCSAAGQ